MSRILLVADQQSTIDRMHAELSGADVTIIDHTDPGTAAATAYDQKVDAVLVDIRVGAMGGMAVVRDVRAHAGESDPIHTTILLDRQADTFLAGRSGATNWVKKSASGAELRAVVVDVKAGQ